MVQTSRCESHDHIDYDVYDYPLDEIIHEMS